MPDFAKGTVSKLISMSLGQAPSAGKLRSFLYKNDFIHLYIPMVKTLERQASLKEVGGSSHWPFPKPWRNEDALSKN